METSAGSPTDLSGPAWALREPLIPPPKRGGRPRRVDVRALCNALFSIDRAGRQGRMRPREYPNWKTVSWYFTRWQDDGRWESVTDALRRQVRHTRGRDPEPSAAIIDRQSVTTTEKGGTWR